MTTKNLTTYTETDTQSRLTVDADYVTAAGLVRTDTGHVQYDYGADYFNALNHYCDGKETSSTIFICGGFTVSSVATVMGSGAYDLFFAIDTADNLVRLMRSDFGTQDNHTGCAVDTDYFLTFSRAAGSDVVSMSIYDDAARTNLLETLSISGLGTTKWRYHAALINYGGATAASTSGRIGKWDFNEAAGNPYYYYANQ